MNALLWHSRGWPSGQRPSLVGRLDKDTSGIVLVAKSAAMHAALQRTMSTAATRKDYLAVVHGRVNVASGQIDMRLARDAADRRKVVASDSVGAASLTRFERLARGTDASLLRCRLITGRTHQIRVHLAARGWAIVGDHVYGNPRPSRIGDHALRATLDDFPRQALHASRLTFAHPITGCPVAIEVPVPTDIERLLIDAGIGTVWR
jgi:23S rRNA pseudouridine1911/1915/1917 synthase